MDWMRNLYEKIKPYIWIPILICIIWLVTADIMGTRRDTEFSTALGRVNENLVETRNVVRDGLSDLSDLASGIEGISETASDLRDLGTDLRSTSDRLESAILQLGDTSTESGLLADRQYRISRELAKREQETTE